MDPRRYYHTVLILLMTLTIISNAKGGCPTTHPKCTCSFDSHNFLTSILCKDLEPMESLPYFNATDEIVPTLRIENASIYKLETRAFNGLKIRNLLLNVEVSVVEQYALQGLESYLESLELNGGKFAVLPDYFLFNFTSLKTLALDRNNLDIVKANWFMHLSSLTYLSMSGNRIRDIERGSFDLLPSLRVLYLTDNKLTYLSDKIFSSLSTLAELGLGSNNITTLPKSIFSSLLNLRWLDLGRNEIEDIPDGIFERNTRLEELFFPSNKIREIGPTKLATGGSLKTLVLSNNNISTLYDSAFHSIPNVKRLYLDKNNINRLPDLAFESLRFLEELHLQDNEINELPSNIFVGLLQLREMNLQQNNIEVLTYGVFDPLGSLIRLDLSSNEINEVHFGPFDALRKLKYLDMSRNKLPSVQLNFFKTAESLEELYLNHNVIRSIEDKTFTKLLKLMKLNLDYNYIQEIDPTMFSKNHELRELSLSHNPLKVAPVGTLGSMPKLETLYLNYTCLTSIPTGFFTNLSQLRELYLDHSPLGAIQSYSFSPLRGLHTLILGYHNITDIGSRPFANLKNITNFAADSMGLTQNELPNLLVDIDNATRISLQYNNIRQLQENVFLYNSHLEEISLLGNPLVCDCQLAWLRRWEILSDIQETFCGEPRHLATELAACFPLHGNCPPTSPLPSTEQLCQSAPPMGALPKDSVLDYSHCVVPPEPTTPVPTTVTTTQVVKIAPANVSIEASSRDIVVTWDKKENPLLRGFRVRYRQFATTEFKNSPDLSVNDTSYVIRDLEPGLNYRVCVDLKFNGGYSRYEAGCKEVGIEMQSKTTGSTPQDDVNQEAVETEKSLPLVPIVGASAAAFIVIFCVIVIIVFCLRKTKTRFAQNAKKKEDREKIVKDKMGVWVSNFNFDGNVNETMGEQMMLDYDLFSGSNPTVSRARHAQMLKEAIGAIPEEYTVENEQEDIDFPEKALEADDMIPRKSDYPDVLKNTEIQDDDFPGDTSGSDPGYGESETGYNGSDSMQDGSERNEHLLF